MTLPHGLRRWVGLMALVLGAVLLVFFGTRAWHQWTYAQRVASGEVQVQTLRGWMTLSYIARVYHVPEADLRTALGAPMTGFEERSLKDWLDRSGADPVEGRRRVEALILQASARQGTQP
ncbi:MAG: hypothetical protein U1D25_03850 [Hydrogenophaga sp.]|uniref:hypothetical protein n=1 Tax=Hydrogenophaga sp. TaxID=1904254 RepID=UPI002778437E|nr:hypothetical protein [Hydrogenophaga sp.]MDP2418331.1 hypothetical protein [Hydrogenophaga sp.]MDZ4187234.1 hypothetical protein [Hydrogenophaga sp.]